MMYLARLTIENFRCFGEGEDKFILDLNPGLTALVGENDCGKSAIIDAIRFALGTTDQEWYRIEDEDIHDKDTSKEIKIELLFKELTPSELAAYVEYLTYEGDGQVLYIHWSLMERKAGNRNYRPPEIHSGRNGDGPNLDQRVRELLRATYLRPLRDAEEALSAGRRSRLAQILEHTSDIHKGVGYDLKKPLEAQELSVLSIGHLFNELLKNQKAIVRARKGIDENLKSLNLKRGALTSEIDVDLSDNKDVQLRQLLEKLDLTLTDMGRSGLGSNNLLFMACESLLLAQEDEENKLLLIEEPEAHLHAQQQLRVMKFLQQQAEGQGIQVIVTTHSPNLASVIKLNSMVMIKVSKDRKAFSLAEDLTRLEKSDYRFLERFLDVTKANLFFARGVMIVEGDAENILIPTLARLIDRDFTDYGVSIVNVGGTGLRRYARIFQRKNEEQMCIPVACIADMDVMPDCAPEIIGRVEKGKWPQLSDRKWRVKSDFGPSGNGSDNALQNWRKDIESKADGQCVKTFVSDQWTLEYDLAFAGLAKPVFLSARLAASDDSINADKTTGSEIRKKASEDFEELKKKTGESKERLASEVYAQFRKGNVSKPIAAQQLAELLVNCDVKTEKYTPEFWRRKLPKYLVNAIDYVTGHEVKEEETDE